VVDDEDDAPRSGRPLWWRLVVRNPRDSFLVVVAAGAMTAIVVNGLFLQPGPHPAPLFAVRSPVAVSEPTGTIAMPRPRPATVDAGRQVAPASTPAPQSSTRTRGEIITDMQRELARRGYYDGTVDGIYGSRTDAALREFEQASGVKTGGEMNEAALQAILRAPAVPAKAKTPLPQPAPRRDPIAELITPAAQPAPPPAAPPAAPVPTPSRQLVAVQRVLGDFGYGQVRPTGVFDPETRAAIERFERGRNMPVTGQLSERLVRELGAMSGRPLE
jgi:peptidoglycan hydrolase-like protein with peptidoglycan-binding domain